MKTTNSAIPTVQAFLFLATVIMTLLLSVSSFAQITSATWTGESGVDNWAWGDPANWTPMIVPSGTATFAASQTTNVSTAGVNAEPKRIVFSQGGVAFTISTFFPDIGPGNLIFQGTGIVNNSGVTQSFVADADDFALGIGGVIEFTGSATAGHLTVFIAQRAGEISFNDTSTADSGVFTTAGGVYSATVLFNESSTAGNSTIVNNGGTSSGEAGGFTEFSGGTGGNATLIANGGTGGGMGGFILFANSATAGNARIEVFGNGYLQMSSLAPGLTIGSIEGTGAVLLGASNLTVGTNNRSTTFSGVIQNGDGAGSLIKAGNGTLTLSNANTYTGGTAVSSGTLLVRNGTGSATGSGAVQVNAGTLAGTGKISGVITVGSGATPAVLAPGNAARPGTLTTLRTLTFGAQATYKIDLNSTTVTADKVVAKGVTINSGALVSIDDLGSSTLTTGTVFTVISNTATTPIAGTFSNLPDGGTITVGPNTLQASYEGGDGNDLTLTVVP